MRQHFLLDEGVTFINHGAFGATPKPVLEAAARVRHELERQPVRFFEQTYEGLLEQARAEVARFVGARPDDLAFVPNTTTGVNAVLGSLELLPGDVILTTDHAYNACKNAVDFVARGAGATVEVVRIPLPITDSEEVVERVLAAATAHVKLAMIDHVTSQTGLVFPIERIVSTLKERGIDTLVDGAHAPGMVPMRVAELGAAYYVGNFHKWVCAPKGAAMLWVRADRQSRLHPTTISHGYNSSRDRSRFLEEFDWTGSIDPSPYLATPEAIRFVGSLLPGGWDAVYARNRALALTARRMLEGALGVAPLAPESMIGSLASVSLPDGAPDASTVPPLEPLHRALADQHGVEVPVFVWPAPPKRLIRISAHLYNTEQDYEALVRALDVALRCA
ncbi:MAG TPA: aminotransferase class V-fold PLP-dependent enzyme [Polyangiaceae bacterium]|jgi:isopenicillin-N epimerase|nr:aminotransferase class V-fold PLP-dependent enzyme [Polyangiaceae bacterium]